MRFNAIRASVLLCALLPTFHSTTAFAQACTAPGPELVSDPAGDQTGAPAGQNAALDIRSVAFAEPNWADGVRRLTVTLKVSTLATVPASATWQVQFIVPGTPATTYFVSMNTGADQPAPSYNYGTVGTTSTTLGAAELQSGHTADGTITLVINASKIGTPAPGTTLTGIRGITQQKVGTATGSFNSGVDSTPSPGSSYTMVAANDCPKVDADGDGVLDGQDACPNTPPGTAVKPNGCPVVAGDSDGDGVVDGSDQCPMTPADTPVDADGCPLGPPEATLHFHGNPIHDAAGEDEFLCTGSGAADLIACDGPFLHPSSELGDSAAAVWEGNPALAGADRSIHDPNWIWHLSEPTTIEGPAVLQWWATCAGCADGASSADWVIRVWADGVKKHETRLTATPTAPNAPSKLTAQITLPEITANTNIVLHIDPFYTASQQNTKIYYDSSLPCPGSAEEGCDSLVVFNAKDTDGDSVLDFFDKCQATPPGTPVDAEGCPAASACVSGAAATAQARTPTSGFIRVDAAVSTDLAKLAPSANYGAFVHFFRQGTNSEQDAVLRAAGLAVRHDFRRYGTFVYVEGPALGFNTLMRHPWIRRIEKNRELRYHDATQSWATRSRMAQEKVADGPWLDANGDIISGKGITLGIIDSGMFGAHPDFGGLARISHNYKLISPVGGPMYYQDVGVGDSENGGGGHGTHVSGTTAGGGNQSNGGYPDASVAPQFPGTFAAAAPDVKILHWGNGAGIFVLSVTLAYQHMLDNMGLPEFASLKAVNNSYGGDGGEPYNEGDASSQLIKQIVGCGVNMVFSAGNDGGDGSADLTNATCKDPTPGVICVASYNDQGTGTINGPLSVFSSRSKKGIPENYVDIASPGDLTTSTCAQATPTQAICTGGDDQEAETEWQPWYGTISGTSMASPNITSIIGLLSQADPTLTPGEREDIIKDTARKVGSGYEPDPRNPDGTTHFGYGAGLVNTQAALERIGVTKSPLPAAGLPFTIFVQDADPALSSPAADIVALEMQEFSDPAGDHGVEYRIAVRDIAAFGGSSAIAYRIEQNVDGKHYETTVTATAAEVTIPPPGAGNTAPAKSVGRVGNEIRVKIAYSALGYPQLLAPIHNIAAYSSDQTGTLDFAPSPPNSTGSQATLQPMYGRAFTVRNPVPLPEDTESVCVMPGKTKLRDDPGDQVQTPPGVDAPYDLLSVHVAEPGDGPFAGKIVFTIKMRGLDVVPSGTRWALRFNGPKPPPAGRDDFFVMMTTEEGAAPTFVYGTTGVTTDPSGTAGARTFAIAGDLDASSNFNVDGTIQLVMTRDNALIGPLSPGDTLIKIFPSVRAPATPNNNAIYDQGGEFEHTLIDPQDCLNPKPIASLVALTAIVGDPPLTVSFDASGSTDADGIASYTFNFGDGSDPVTQDEPLIEHEYTEAGVFTASLTVTDTKGADSVNTAQVAITVNQLPAPPTVEATGNDVIEGAAGALSAIASDPNGDPITFAWQQVKQPASEPTVTLTGADTATPTFTAPDVCTSTVLHFAVTVADGTGLTATDQVALTVQNVNAVPVADAGADFAVDERKTVLLTATATDGTDCDELSYAWEQVSGPAVVLSDDSIASPTFNAPEVTTAAEDLVFRVTVSDGIASDSDEIVITVREGPVVIGDAAAGGLGWLTLAGLGLGGLIRRRRRSA